MRRAMSVFQSAVAHELISNPHRNPEARPAQPCFKALSRMSSFPTRGEQRCNACGESFQSAVAHELISNPFAEDEEAVAIKVFQSAVAHELISNSAKAARAAKAYKGFKALSRMSSFPTCRACPACRGTA